jgi:hypothetical protein
MAAQVWGLRGHMDTGFAQVDTKLIKWVGLHYLNVLKLGQKIDEIAHKMK